MTTDERRIVGRSHRTLRSEAVKLQSKCVTDDVTDWRLTYQTVDELWSCTDYKQDDYDDEDYCSAFVVVSRS